MKYVLDKRYRLRGWERAPFAVFDTLRKEPAFVPKNLFVPLMRCDGAHDIPLASLEGDEGVSALHGGERRHPSRPVR